MKKLFLISILLLSAFSVTVIAQDSAVEPPQAVRVVAHYLPWTPEQVDAGMGVLEEPHTNVEPLREQIGDPEGTRR